MAKSVASSASEKMESSGANAYLATAALTITPVLMQAKETITPVFNQAKEKTKEIYEHG